MTNWILAALAELARRPKDDDPMDDVGALVVRARDQMDRWKRVIEAAKAWVTAEKEYPFGAVDVRDASRRFFEAVEALREVEGD